MLKSLSVRVSRECLTPKAGELRVATKFQSGQNRCDFAGHIYDCAALPRLLEGSTATAGHIQRDADLCPGRSSVQNFKDLTVIDDRIDAAGEKIARVSLAPDGELRHKDGQETLHIWQRKCRLCRTPQVDRTSPKD